MDGDRGVVAVIGLRRALLALAVAGFAFGVILAVTLATSRHVDLRRLEATLALVIGWGFIGAGLYAWWRRPQNNFGPLITATGFLFFVSELAASNSPLVFNVSTLWGNLFLGVVVHMLLAMPSGRLRTRAERVLVAGHVRVHGAGLPRVLPVHGHAGRLRLVSRRWFATTRTSRSSSTR